MKTTKNKEFSKSKEAIKKMNAFLDDVKLNPSHLNYFYAYKQIKKLDLSIIEYSKKSQIKIALLSSFTIDLLGIYLDINCRLLNLHPQIYIGPFNQYQQEIINESSQLYNFNPDIILLNIQPDALLTQNFLTNFPRFSTPEIQIEQINLLNPVYKILDTLRQRLSSIVLVSNFITPLYSPFGILDKKVNLGYIEFFKQLNENLAIKYRNDTQIHVFDLDKVASAFGKSNIINYTMNYRGNILFDEKFLPILAYEYEGYIKALKNLNRKCIVLDLDNTLWGGIIGEDGIDGIKLNNNYPGNEFVDFQQLILSYYNRGIILAISSKNNYEDALEVLQNHPAMVLREKHFASMKINWNDKVDNLLQIADELNIGIDSLVFIDDNLIERERIRQALPEVLVVEMPTNPSLYRQTLETLNDFNSYSLTAEDFKRGEMYVARRKRQILKTEITSIESFIESLEITIEIKNATDFALPRITSLINRTNQFNLTTRRYTENEIQNVFADSANYLIFSLKVVDKFGDEGIVGVVMIKKFKDKWIIDNFLMSCRVIGRKIETVLINYIIKEAKKSNIKQLVGEYLPTKKNILVKDFYKQHDFSFVEEDKGKIKWVIELDEIEVQFPKFIKVITD